MGIEQARTEKGRQAARGWRKSAAKEEKKVEAQKVQALPKVRAFLKNVPKAPTARALEQNNVFDWVPFGADRNQSTCE